MQIVVRLRVDGAHVQGGIGDTAGRAEVEALLQRFGVALIPLHPNATDPTLASWFVLSDTPPGRAEEIAAALRGLDAVEAAYVQPRPAPA